MRNKNFIILFLLVFILRVHAQENHTFGDVSTAELEMTECPFEKDANAMYLFSIGEVICYRDYSVTFEVHKRIKIFNEKGKKEGDIRIEYHGNRKNGYESIVGLEAQTVNLVDGKPEITIIDKKSILSESVDLITSAKILSFPNVRAGSVIEFKYKLKTYGIPSWFFQTTLPVQLSRFQTTIPEEFDYSITSHGNISLVKSVRTDEPGKSQNPNNLIRTMTEVPALLSEPYMSSQTDNLTSIAFKRVSSGYGAYNDTWEKIHESLLNDDDFAKQFWQKLKGEKVLIEKAKTYKTDAGKIAYLFNEVKNAMKWDGTDAWYTMDGTIVAWSDKVGNSAEINLILYHLLIASDVKAYPMVVSTKSHGKLNIGLPSFRQFNKTVVYIPVDSTFSYYLDATDKYQAYNEIPEFMLNSQALFVDKKSKGSKIVFIQRTDPVREVSFVNAEISPDGKLKGSAIISSQSYNKQKLVEKYKTDGEEKIKTFIKNDDSNIKILSYAIRNIDVDTLPLLQEVGFEMDPVGSDEQYIFLNTNLFTNLKTNPFISESRSTDIHFGYKQNYLLTCSYKIPQNFKVETLPKSINLVTADKSIAFKRVFGEDNNQISMRVSIDIKNTIYFKENYLELWEFYKKMFELLNEQIVLKKG